MQDCFGSPVFYCTFYLNLSYYFWIALKFPIWYNIRVNNLQMNNSHDLYILGLFKGIVFLLHDKNTMLYFNYPYKPNIADHL